jgi:uncharacterized membrane protein HdeD (DUF308 family)
MRIAIVNVGTLAANWAAVLFRGLAAVAFGLVTVMAPGLSLLAWVTVFGAYAFVDGVLALVSALRRRGRTEPLWRLVLQGIAGISVGVITLIWPGISAVSLLYLLAAWAIVTGGLEIATAVSMRKQIEGEWLLILSGVLSVILGVVLALFPGPGALALVLWLGVYALVSGALLIAHSIRLRSWAKSHEPFVPSRRETVTS